MIEKYIIDELNKYKEENEHLKKELNDERNKYVQWVEEKPIEIELIDKDVVIRKLLENNIDIIKIAEETDVKDMVNIIKDLKLYREKAKRNNSSRYQQNVGVIKINNKYYILETYYSDFKIERQIFIDLDEAIYNELTDELYDIALDYKRKQKEENKED